MKEAADITLAGENYASTIDFNQMVNGSAGPCTIHPSIPDPVPEVTRNNAGFNYKSADSANKADPAAYIPTTAGIDNAVTNKQSVHIATIPIEYSFRQVSGIKSAKHERMPLAIATINTYQQRLDSCHPSCAKVFISPVHSPPPINDPDDNNSDGKCAIPNACPVVHEAKLVVDVTSMHEGCYEPKSTGRNRSAIADETHSYEIAKYITKSQFNGHLTSNDNIATNRGQSNVHVSQQELYTANVVPFMACLVQNTVLSSVPRTTTDKNYIQTQVDTFEAEKTVIVNNGVGTAMNCFKTQLNPIGDKHEARTAIITACPSLTKTPLFRISPRQGAVPERLRGQTYRNEPKVFRENNIDQRTMTERLSVQDGKAGDGDIVRHTVDENMRTRYMGHSQTKADINNNHITVPSSGANNNLMVQLEHTANATVHNNNSNRVDNSNVKLNPAHQVSTASDETATASPGPHSEINKYQRNMAIAPAKPRVEKATEYNSEK